MAELTRYVDESGDTVLTVYNLTPPEPVDCCMCGRATLDHFAVPYYCGPVRSGKSEGGYAAACRGCYDRWARWDDALEEYDSWLAVLAHGVAASGEPHACRFFNGKCIDCGRSYGDRSPGVTPSDGAQQ